ncbi:hypothetical protein Pfo_024599 [Paulownia fortunei]|nr:hypothetical protein Pfo_024599 [Paulownia fortunei]
MKKRETLKSESVDIWYSFMFSKANSPVNSNSFKACRTQPFLLQPQVCFVGKRRKTSFLATMAFWGVEVKPGKPLIHSCVKAKGKVRITQATLGMGNATEKSLVQCKVGRKSPIFVCALLPNKFESCPLDLKFAETDDVIFSIIGPRSVHLTGYHACYNQLLPYPHSDTESYGINIEYTGTEVSSDGSEDDKCEDSFIDDSELAPAVAASSPGIDKMMPGRKKPKNKKHRWTTQEEKPNHEVG